MKAFEITSGLTDEQRYAKIKAHLHLVGYGSDEYKRLKSLLDYLYAKINQ